MIKDAESHAEEDRRQRELAEARNVGENAAYQAEKQLGELGDQVDDAAKAEIDEGDRGRSRGVARVRRRRGDQGEDRRPAGAPSTRSPSRSTSAAAEQQAAARPADGASADGAGDAEEEVVDAEVVDDDRS